MLKLYRNRKNQKIYSVLDSEVINCTNEVDGQQMVLYTIEDKYFVREYSEFMVKFEAVQS